MGMGVLQTRKFVTPIPEPQRNQICSIVGFLDFEFYGCRRYFRRGIT